jgi:hypothetical protein
MAQVREQNRSTPPKKARRKRILGRNSAGKIAFKAGANITEVSVSKALFERIVGKPRPIGKMLAGYANTVTKARKTGRFVTVTFRVSPDGDAEPVVAEPDALDAAWAAAKARGQVKVAEILKGEDMLTARDFGPLIGASHETVHAKRRRFEVLGLEAATRGVKYPRWQVTDAGLPLPGLTQLFTVLGKQPWTVYRFLRNSHPELGGRTALDALKAGQVEAVVAVARNQVTGTFA